MKCEACDQSLKRAMILALLVDFGAKTSPGPNYCPATDDHEHKWIEEKQKEVQDES